MLSKSFFPFFTRQEYVSELFHYLHSSAESPQLLALLESFLFSVVRDVKHYSSENQRLEDALKRSVNHLVLIYLNCYPLGLCTYCTIAINFKLNVKIKESIYPHFSFLVVSVIGYWCML